MAGFYCHGCEVEAETVPVLNTLTDAMESKRQSYLEKAILQTTVVQKILASDVEPQATFLGMRDLLGLDCGNSSRGEKVE